MESSSNVFKFQGSNMIVRAKGPNIEKRMNLSTNFHSNLLSSTVNMPRNFERASYTESVVSQRSIYGRESSPTASIRSDLQPRNFHQPFYQRGFSQRSVNNGRGGSPMSVRTIDSSVTIAEDVAQAISSGKFNKYELKMIEQALRNIRKHDFRKRAEKRRKMMKYLRKMQNRSGDDSGEPCSNSSSSSDDCASTRTGYSQRYDINYKENVPQNISSLYCQSEDLFRNDDRYTYGGYARTDSQNPYRKGTDSYLPANILPCQKETQGPNMYFPQKIGLSDKSTLPSQQNPLSSTQHIFSSQMNTSVQGNNQRNMFSTQRNTLNTFGSSTKSMQNMSMTSLKDRFRGGFQFPSQRVNKSSTLYEGHEQNRPQQLPNKECANNSRKNLLANHIEEDSDENSDIFVDTTVKPKSVTNNNSDSRQKRKIDEGDTPTYANKKKQKTTCNNDDETRKHAQKKNKSEQNDFEFAKPQLPIWKSAPGMSQEKMISKSKNAPELVFDAQKKENTCSQPVEALGPEPEVETDQFTNTQLTTSDMSMRPSFMKRKLFTQTLDVTERKNNSSESLTTESPQSNIYSALSREKHKTRKLVISQSLLSRDVNQDDNNLLDLIHKIVPPNQVNSTVTSNNTKSFNARVSESKVVDADDKWDITSIISTCNNDSVSETYTDDEIFKVANYEKKSKPQKKPTSKQTNRGNNKATSAKAIKKANDTSATSAIPECTTATDNINKMCKVGLNKITPAAPKIQTPVKACPATNFVLSSSLLDAFWKSDVESDYERAATPRAPKLKSCHGHPPIDIASPKQNSTEIRPSTLSTKLTKTHKLSPVVALKNDAKLLTQHLKKQASNKLSTKSESKNDYATPPRKPGRPKKGTPTIKLQTKRQRNIPTLEAVKNPLPKKLTSSSKIAPISSTTEKKRNNVKKATQENNAITKSSSEIPKTRNRRLNDSRHRINISNKSEPPKSQRRAKEKTTGQKHVEHENYMTSKMLRSRVVDISSSFNSDKFELTMARTRNSRTPSKRISFNNPRNVMTSSNNNKTRGRATKA